MASDAIDKTIDNAKSVCRSVLMANSYGILAQNFAKEYEGLTGGVLPLKKMGINHIMDLPKVMPDVIKQERNAQGMVVFYCVANQQTAHIAKMISNEKKKSGKKNKSRAVKKIFYSDADAGGSKAVTSYGPSISNRSTMGSKRSTSYMPPRISGMESGSSRNSSYQPFRPSSASYSSTFKPAAAKFNNTSSGSKYQPPSASRSSNISAAVQSVHSSSPAYNTSDKIKISVPGNMLRTKVGKMMETFVSGLWGAKLVMEYEKFFNEEAPEGLLQLVIQMDGTDVRVERPFGQNNARVIIYSMKDTSGPMSKQLESTAPQEVRDPSIKTTMTPKYPSTYRYTHEHLPWLGVRLPCYVTLANNPEYFWVQFKSAHLTDLEMIMVDMQTECQNSMPPRDGRFRVDELVCGLFTDGQWYRAIVIDVGHASYSAKARMDPAVFLPGKPAPIYPWEDKFMVKLFFIDYGNVEFLPLSKVRQQSFPYPPGQAFRCSLGAILPNAEWTAATCKTFKKITENSEDLLCTTDAVKSDRAHYGFKSRLQEFCQKNRYEIPTYDKPLNTDGGWKTQCHIKDGPASSKNHQTFMGFYQNKKNDAEASAAQRVIRHWDVNLLSSREVMDHWLEVQLEDFKTGEHINKSLVESGAAIAKTSIYELCIPRQPLDMTDVPMPVSGMTYLERPVIEISDDSDSDSVTSNTNNDVQREAQPVEMPEIGEVININITYVTSCKNFAVRITGKGYTQKLYKLEDDMTDSLKLSPRRPDTITVDMLVAVLLDDKNYRGRVLKSYRNSDKFEVLFLDYGDTDTFERSKLMFLDTEKYCDLPYQAVSCCLYGMENIIDVPKISLAMRTMLPEDTNCRAQVKSIVNETMLSVNIYSEEGEDMNKVFLSHDIQSLKPSLPDNGDLHSVRLTNISDDGVISLQVPGPGVRALGKMMEELTLYYEERGALKAADYIPDPQEGQICCASFKGQDNKINWYRALVLRSIPEDHQVEVQYVDYGNTNCIAISKLREPTNAVPNLSRLPYQSVSVVLDGLPTDPTLWTTLEMDTLKRYVKDQTIVAQVISTVGNYSSVKLLIDYNDEEPPKEVNNLMLIDNNLFLPPKPAPLQQPAPQLDIIHEFRNMTLPNIINIAPDDIMRSEAMLPRLKITRCLSVIIPYVEDPSQWAFQPTEYYNQLNAQSVELQNFYSQQMMFAPDLFVEGEICVGYVEVYSGWYRARITQIDHKLQQAKCFMIDYGDSNTLPLSNLRPLTKAFATLPIQACTAALANVQPLIDGPWDEAAKRAFKEYVLDKHLWVKILMVDSITKRVNAEIIDTRTESDVHMSEILVREGLARHIVPRPSPLQPADTPITA